MGQQLGEALKPRVPLFEKIAVLLNAYPGRLSREVREYILTTAELSPDRLGTPHLSIERTLILAPIGQAAALSAHERRFDPVEQRTSTPTDRAAKPDPGATIIAGSPIEHDRLIDVGPDVAFASVAEAEHDSAIVDANGNHSGWLAVLFPFTPEARPRSKRALTLPESHVERQTLAHRWPCVVPAPVPGAIAAHRSRPFSPK